MATSEEDIVVSPLLQTLLDKLASDVLVNFGSNWSVQKELDELADTLGTIQAMLRFLEIFQTRDLLAKRYLKKLREVGYDVDAVLQEFTHEVHRNEKDLMRGKRQLRKYIYFSLNNADQILHQHEIGPLISDLKEKLVQIENNLKPLHCSIGSSLHLEELLRTFHLEFASKFSLAVGYSGSSGGGILASMSPPVLDDMCSTSTSTSVQLRSFLPQDDRGASSSNYVKGSSIHEEDGAFEEDVSDDNCSSSTTRGSLYDTLPHGRSRIQTWIRGDLLGVGSFSSVYEGITEDGSFIAVKEVSLRDGGRHGKESLYQLEQEIALLSRFEHENIVQYLGADKDDERVYIFLEFVAKGSLVNIYRKYHLLDSQVSAYTRQILNGLKYLHERNVLHRDIKCANILVDASGSVKLADFGLAEVTKLNDLRSRKGTAFWMAPEVIQGSHGYGLAADIWSLGCTVLEMLTREHPYGDLECMKALFKIGRGGLPRIPNSLSRDARDFILQCLKVSPDERPTAAQLLEHPYVKRPLPTSSVSVSPHKKGRYVWVD